MAEDNDDFLDPCVEPPVSDEDEFANQPDETGDQNSDPEENEGLDETSEPDERARTVVAVDESVTPNREQFGLHHEEYAAGKSVWLFHRHSLIGESTDDPTYIYGDSKLDPMKPNGLPAHVPGPGGRKMIDSFRYVTGKFWKNNVQSYSPSSTIEFENQRPKLVYHNSTDILFHGATEAGEHGQPTIHSVTSLELTVRRGIGGFPNGTHGQAEDVGNYESWTNIEDILARHEFQDRTSLGIPVSYEPLRIRFPFVHTPTLKWHWQSYLYGLPTFHHQARGALPNESAAQMNNKVTHFADLRRRKSAWAWGGGRGNQNRNWSEQRANFSENLYPVIPFFGTPGYPGGDILPHRVQLPVFAAIPPKTGEHVFHDYSTNIPVLFTEEEIENNQLRGGPTVSIKGEYNFYSDLYENIVLQRYEERQLPNFYVFRPESYVRLDEDGNLSAEERLSEENLIDNFGIIPGRSPLTASYGDPSAEEFRGVYDSDRYLFPMYTDIQLSSVEKSPLAQSLVEGQNKTATENLFRKISGASLNGWKTVTQVVESAEDVRELKTSTISDVRLRSLRLGTWFREWGATDDLELHPVEKFRLLFTKHLMKSRIKNIIKRTTRTFMECLRGKPAHSEVIGYKIEKRDVEANNEVIQAFYLATNDKTEVIKLVDSQVKYSKRYNYIVYQIVIIVGTVYAYSDCMNAETRNEFWDAEGQIDNYHDFYMGVVHRPSIKVVELPVYSKEVVVMDHPPISPNINVIPFKGDKRRLMFNMDSQTGNFAAKPVILEPDDTEQFSLIAISQGADPNLEDDVLKSKVEFKNDDPVQIFEVFRVEQEPTSWGSFFQSKIARIESDATAAAFMDKIIPNKKYWYTFRTEDLHGHVSNPSNIYQIKLVSDLDAVYLRSDLFYFPHPERKSIKSFKKHILIEPAYAQRILELPDEGNFSSWESTPGTVGPVGISQHPVWGKQFKIRITSKSTGKQIDLNFNFTKDYSNMVDR